LCPTCGSFLVPVSLEFGPSCFQLLRFSPRQVALSCELLDSLAEPEDCTLRVALIVGVTFTLVAILVTIVAVDCAGFDFLLCPFTLTGFDAFALRVVFGAGAFVGSFAHLGVRLLRD
jgi:hypothetical protein